MEGSVTKGGTRLMGSSGDRREVATCPDCKTRFGNDATFCPFDGSRLERKAYEPPSDPLVGTVIDGRYEVRRVLGEGGMGTVYEVQHRTLGRGFAMKLLRRDVGREPDLAARFLHEAKATARLRHPHVVSITDFGQLADGTPYFVMELLVGETLADVVKAGPVPVPRASRILLDVAAALAAAHEAGIVHRDLKPENVFLARSPRGGPGDEDVKLVDFGAAKVVGASRITKTGIVFGTPHYMSPEQASGGAVDHRADIYAFGVIMYEMLTGRVPFEADTYMGVLTQHMFVQPRAPSQVRPELAAALGALEEITLRALEKRPEDRYQTMNGLAADLERASRGETVDKRRKPSSVAPGLLVGNVARESWRGARRDRVSVGSGPVPAIAGLRKGLSFRGVLVGGVLVGACALGAIALGRTRAPTAPAATAKIPVAPPAPVPGPAATEATIPSPTTTASSGQTAVPAAAPSANPIVAAPRAAAPARRSDPPPRRALTGEIPDPWAK